MDATKFRVERHFGSKKTIKQEMNETPKIIKKEKDISQSLYATPKHRNVIPNPIPLTSRSEPTNTNNDDLFFEISNVKNVLNEIRQTRNDNNNDNNNDIKKDVKIKHKVNDHVMYAYNQMQLIVNQIIELNPMVSSQILKQFKDKKHQINIVKSILKVPFIMNMIKTSQNDKKQYFELIKFFIDYYSQLYPDLNIPKTNTIISDTNNDNGMHNPSQKATLQLTPNEIKKNNNTKAVKKETVPVSNDDEKETIQGNNIKGVDIKMLDDLLAKMEMIQNKTFNMQQNNFDYQQNINNERIKWENEKRKEVESLHKQQYQLINQTTQLLNAIHKLSANSINVNNTGNTSNNNNNNNNMVYNDEMKNDKMKLNRLRNEAKELENVTTRIESALDKIENPKFFQKRINHLTKQTLALQNELNNVEHVMTSKAKDLENTVANTFNKFHEMNNTAQLISAGVNPSILPYSNNNDNNNNNVDTTTPIVDEIESKMSFLNEFKVSSTGFDYDKKKKEIKNLIQQVCDIRNDIEIDNIHANTMEFYMPTIKLKPISVVNMYDNEFKNDDEKEHQKLIDKISKKIQESTKLIENHKPKKPEFFVVRFIIFICIIL